MHAEACTALVRSPCRPARSRFRAHARHSAHAGCHVLPQMSMHAVRDSVCARLGMHAMRSSVCTPCAAQYACTPRYARTP
eukprot:1382556-Pleurochrysis_carterae.AAC.2